MKMHDRERDVESYFNRKVEALGLKIYKFIPDCRNGMPDRLVTLPDSRVVWVEMKTVGGRLSELQKLRHHELAASGQVVLTVWTKEQADEGVEQLRHMLLGYGS